MKIDMEAKTVNWMLEGVPEDLKQKCKEKAVRERKTLKIFVIETLEKAVGGSGEQSRRAR